MSLLDDGLLRARGERQKVHVDVAARTVLEEVHAARRILPDRIAHLLRIHPEQLAPRAELPRLVESLRERLAHEWSGGGAEVSGQGAVESDDVSSEIDPAALLLARVDRIACLDERITRPP